MPRVFPSIPRGKGDISGGSHRSVMSHAQYGNGHTLHHATRRYWAPRRNARAWPHDQHICTASTPGAACYAYPHLISCHVMSCHLMSCHMVSCVTACACVHEPAAVVHSTAVMAVFCSRGTAGGSQPSNLPPSLSQGVMGKCNGVLHSTYSGASMLDPSVKDA